MIKGPFRRRLEFNNPAFPLGRGNTTFTHGPDVSADCRLNKIPLTDFHALDSGSRYVVFFSYEVEDQRRPAHVPQS